mgnify:CR=1 FL=1
MSLQVATGQGITATSTVDIIYNVGGIDNVAVKLTSTQDTVGIALNAVETGVDTGIFKVNVTLSSAASNQGAATLLAQDGSSFSAAFTDTPASGSALVRTAAAQVEIGKPIFSGLLPVTKTSTQVLKPAFSGTITDMGGSGIKVNTVTLNLDVDGNGVLGGAGEVITPVVVGSDGAATVTFSYTPTVDLGEGAHNWNVTATDIAGNTGNAS